MSPWTDEHLVELLQDSFATHESQADPDRARRIALAAPQRHRSRPLVLAVAAAVAVLGVGVGVAVVLRPDHRPAPPPAATQLPPVEVGHNRSIASAHVARLLRLAPRPPGATPRAAAPSRALSSLGVYYDDVDHSLSEHRWFVVPMSYQQLVAWYAHHSPAELGGTNWPTPVPQGDMDWAVGSPTAAYTQPAYVVSYDRLGPDSTGLRVDVTLAARFDRTTTTLVPIGQLTQVTVRQTSFNHPPDRDAATIDDPSWLRSIGSAFNATRGAPAGSEPHPCGSPTGDYRLYAVTFRWPGHELDIGFGQPLCGIGRDLTLDGRQLPQRLEDGAALNRALKAALAS